MEAFAVNIEYRYVPCFSHEILMAAFMLPNFPNKIVSENFAVIIM